MEGLDPFERHSAGIACWYTGPKPATHEWPNNTFYGSYVAACYGGEGGQTKEQALASTAKYDAPYDLRYNTNSVVNNTDGSIVGYKYFNFDAERLSNPANLMLCLRVVPEGIDGTIEVIMDRPWTSQVKEKGLAGKHAIFFVFKSDNKEKSLCTLEDLYFTFDDNK